MTYGVVTGYVEGEEEVVDWCNLDKWKMIEVFVMLRSIGYTRESISVLWYKDVEVGFSEGLRELKGDRGAMDMANIGVEKGIIDLFLLHKTSVDIPVNVQVRAHKVSKMKGKKVVNEDSESGGESESDENSDYAPDEDDYSAYSDLNFNDSDHEYCGDDPLFDVDVTLEDIQQEVRQKQNTKPAKRKEKHAAERISFGLSNDVGVNSDELTELDSEEDEA
ncbi:hypothetical protein PIB30_079081 [Stylosanthes scabra]|uniref:PB1-like domain-containing protein n=1 Tax=Stylosanthes scabra TaxID=79078 RepID=A0ABU6UST0_9FABA|nr:hypothetical protein [Stylosanthes scabra]